MNDKHSVIHCIPAEKFTDPFIDFVERHFDGNQHLFLVKNLTKFNVRKRENVTLISRDDNWFNLYRRYHRFFARADKIIIHSFFDFKVTLILSLQPWMLYKCVWVIWGGDLYSSIASPENIKIFIKRIIQSFVIRRLGAIVTLIEGDYKLAQVYLGARAERLPFFVYPSNICKVFFSKKSLDASLTIMVGNSADPSNNHIQILEQLAAIDDGNICLVVPLSYGDQEYAKKVIDYGMKMFGVRFRPLENFLPIDEYSALLKTIDLAIFNHDRQQALGNIINLLGMGKKVYMKSTINTWDFFADLGIKIYDINQLDLNRLDDATAMKNSHLIGDRFSENKLIDELKQLFS